MASMANWNDEKPLAKVKCRDHDCEKDLHTFLRLRPGGLSYRSEQCSECGANLIEWQRLDRHDLSDVANTVASLQREFIRHQYWHQPIGEKALNYAKRKGLLGLQEAAELRFFAQMPPGERYASPIDLAPRRAELFRDGTQTPKVGNAIHYAQHATATCCRIRQRASLRNLIEAIPEDAWTPMH